MAIAKQRTETARLSLLDRLIDVEPGNPREAQIGPREALRLAVDGVRRDIEDLLNSREAWVADLVDFEQVSRSILSFGLSGIDADPDGSLLPEQIAADIERAIAIFEPRLVGVSVTREDPRGSDRALRFRIDGVLRLDPIREPVSFDTVLKTNRQAEVTAI